LAGISLVKASVDFIKSNISTAQDIGQIAGQIDAMFTGQKQVQEANNKKTGMGLADQFGVQSVAKEMIDARLAAEQVAEVARMVDFRFGHGTWAGILAERQKRIQQAKEARARQRKIERERQQEMFENFKVGAIVVGLIVVIIGLFIGVMAATAGVIVK
jgi:glycerol uptake facilitator-like aquaporin